MAQTAPAQLNVADQIALHLDSLSASFTFDVAGTTVGNVYVGHAPASQDEAIQIKMFGDGAVSERLPYNNLQIQFTVRAATYVASYDLAYEIFDLLHAAAPLTLPGGAKITHCYAVQMPIDLGLDDQDRYEHSVNLAIEVRADTTHR